MYTELLRKTLIEIRHYAKRENDIAKKILTFFIGEAEHWRERREGEKANSRLLQATYSGDGNQ